MSFMKSHFDSSAGTRKTSSGFMSSINNGFSKLPGMGLAQAAGNAVTNAGTQIGNAVGNVRSWAQGGVNQARNTSQQFRNTFRQTMPQSYGNAARSVGNVARNAGNAVSAGLNTAGRATAAAGQAVGAAHTAPIRAGVAAGNAAANRSRQLGTNAVQGYGQVKSQITGADPAKPIVSGPAAQAGAPTGWNANQQQNQNWQIVQALKASKDPRQQAMFQQMQQAYRGGGPNRTAQLSQLLNKARGTLYTQ